MDQPMPSAPTPPLTELSADWFDPLEDAVPGGMRADGPITRQLAHTRGPSTLSHQADDDAGAGRGGRGG